MMLEGVRPHCLGLLFLRSLSEWLRGIGDLACNSFSFFNKKLINIHTHTLCNFICSFFGCAFV